MWDPWLVLARHPRYADAFDLHGFAYYYGALVTPRGQLLPYPAGEAPGPVGYVPWDRRNRRGAEPATPRAAHCIL